MSTVGSITLEFSDATTEDHAPVNTRVRDSDYDKRVFRSPYGVTWHTGGTGARNPESFTLSFEVWAATIEAAAPEVDAVLAAVEAAALITTPVGAFVPVGISEVTQTPIEAGYRVDATVIARTGRLADDYGIIRFKGTGAIWELR